MVLTINYADLQNIKEQLINNRSLDEKQIYNYIQCYKDTLSHMYKNSLVPNKSKTDFEYELMNFANDMLKKTDKSYKALEKIYGGNITGSVVTGLKDIRLIL